MHEVAIELVSTRGRREIRWVRSRRRRPPRGASEPVLIRHAIRQTDDWRNWLSRNRDYASRAPEASGLGLGDVDPELDGLVIIGRGSMLDAGAEDRRRRLARSNRTRIETYDWLITQAEDRARPPQVTSSMVQHKDEFEEMRVERAIESVFGDAQSAYVWPSAIGSFSYEYLLLDDWADDRDILYRDVRDYRLGGDTRLSLSDWDD